jgi:hypothetical protein
MTEPGATAREVCWSCHTRTSEEWVYWHWRYDGEDRFSCACSKCWTGDLCHIFSVSSNSDNRYMSRDEWVVAKTMCE